MSVSNYMANNKRIARNTMFLYIRMFISMAVSLYTSRIVLRTLGAEDYGLFSAVGGIIGMFSFINATMSAATSRFLTFEIGKGDRNKLNDTFTASFWVHVIIAIVIAILCETVGLWFIENKMVMPEGREFAVHVVFQLSIISTMLLITQVPYNATLIAHEKMDIYAYVEMANVFLRLAILYLLVVFDFDKLILYSVLNLLLSTGILLFYRMYGKRHYEECRVQFKWQPEIIKPMLKFSSWDLYGNLSVTARTQGVTMLLNVFFGPVVNAASGIATHVQGAVMSFVRNVNVASRPQIIKYYAAGEKEAMASLINNICRITFFIMILIMIPLFGEIDYILEIWLGDYPPYTPVFCIMILVFNIFSNLSSIVVTGVHAYGRIIRPNLINGTLYLLVIPISWLAFKLGADAWIPFLVNIFMVILGLLSNVHTLHNYVPEFLITTFIFDVLFRCIVMMLLGVALILFMRTYFEPCFIRLILTTIVSVMVLGGIGWMVMLRKSDRTKLIELVKSKIHRK